jgi:hypothetical protein
MGMDKNIMCVISFFLGMLIFHLLKGYCGCNNVVEGQEACLLSENGCTCAKANVTYPSTGGGDDDYWDCIVPATGEDQCAQGGTQNNDGNCVKTCEDIGICSDQWTERVDNNGEHCTDFTATYGDKVYGCIDDGGDKYNCVKGSTECMDAGQPQPPADGCCAAPQ